MLGAARAYKAFQAPLSFILSMGLPSPAPYESPLLTPIFQVSTAPPGTQAASLDIEGAYRTIPILPDHKHYLVVCYHDQFFRS